MFKFITPICHFVRTSLASVIHFLRCVTILNLLTSGKNAKIIVEKKMLG